MTILDSIKKIIHSEPAKPKKKALPVEKVEKRPKTAAAGAAVFPVALKAPHVTEKSSVLQAERKYVFKIDGRANKPAIKKVVEKAFGVKVTAVNISNQRGKMLRLGRTVGSTAGFKKATVTLRQGDKIEIGA